MDSHLGVLFSFMFMPKFVPRKKYKKTSVKYTPAEKEFIKEYLKPSAVKIDKNKSSPFGRIVRSRWWLGRNSRR